MLESSNNNHATNTASPIINIVQLTLLSSFGDGTRTFFGADLQRNKKRRLTSLKTKVIATDSEGYHGPSLASSRILPCFVVEQQNAKHHSVLDRYDRSMDMSQVQTKPSTLQILFPQQVTLQHSKQDQALVPNNPQQQHIREIQIHLVFIDIITMVFICVYVVFHYYVL